MITKLTEFEDEIAPGALEIKEHFDQTYDANLQKKTSTLASVAAWGARFLPRSDE